MGFLALATEISISASKAPRISGSAGSSIYPPFLDADLYVRVFYAGLELSWALLGSGRVRPVGLL
jgi:hypothetical protein